MVVTKTLLQRRHMKRCSTWRKNLKIMNIFLQDSSAREDDDQLSPSIKTDLTCSSPLKQCPTFMTYPTSIFNIWRSNWVSVCMIMNCVIDLSTPPYDPIVSESLSVSLSNHQLSILCLSISSSIQQITVRYLFSVLFHSSASLRTNYFWLNQKITIYDWSYPSMFLHFSVRSLYSTLLPFSTYLPLKAVV